MQTAFVETEAWRFDRTRIMAAPWPGLAFVMPVPAAVLLRCGNPVSESERFKYLSSAGVPVGKVRLGDLWAWSQSDGQSARHCGLGTSES